MPHRDTSLAIKHAIYINPIALNATQGYKPSYQQAIYQSQMMGTIQRSKCHRTTQA